jgi:hypothetical protein
MTTPSNETELPEEFPEFGEWPGVPMKLARLRSLLSAHGLHIVTAEERQRMVRSQLDAVVTKAERAVLEACAKVPWDFNEAGNRVHGLLWTKDNAEQVERAELARRGRCRHCGMLTPAGALGPLHHIGCGAGVAELARREKP